MHNLIRVEDHENLRRDPRTNAIVDVNVDAYENYVQSKNRRQQQQQRLDHLENKINNFETDLSEIKHLLQQLLGHQHGHNN
jgi:hypothetical protein